IYPEWEVELYINNEFIAYTKANDNGYFEFNVPLLYGSNYITLKYYGTSGEIRYDERVIQVPFNLLPEGTLEYNVMGGALKSADNNTFSESSVSFGAADFMTVGSGLLYLNRPGISKFYPNANTSVRIKNDLVFSANYFHGLKGTASMSLLLPSQVYTTLSYVRYADNNYFNPLDFREEENLTAYLPFTFSRFSASVRVSARNIEARDYNFRFINSGFFLNYNRIQGSVISNLAWTKGQGKYEDAGSRTITGISYRLLSDLLVRQQTDFNHSSGKISNAGFFIDKGVFGAGWLSVFLFRDFINNSYNGGITFRFDFSFGRYNAGYLSGDNGSGYVQSVSGSVGFDQFTGKFIMDNQNMVSRGGITLVPFLDANNNSRFDENEKILKADFNTNINAGKPVRSEGNNNYWFLGLDPYDTYRLEVNPVSFENPMYRPKYKSYDVTIDPNRFKDIPVPVYISGTISGNAVLKSGNENKGVPSLRVILESEDGIIRLEEMTFSDGEFIFNNVPPGKYRIYADPQDLSRRSLESVIYFHTAEIKNSEDENTAEIPDIVLL
ncbi:MAG: carboxypeptidase-like regulatory domain-containing protein, partial [Ignavibacteria bacterium]|nr:carboxypeptidase-like regulatory domain-containing protein [Ignavibacteria bacterium]